MCNSSGEVSTTVCVVWSFSNVAMSGNNNLLCVFQLLVLIENTLRFLIHSLENKWLLNTKEKREKICNVLQVA